MEERSIARILGLLGDQYANEYIKYWREFECGKTKESKFAKGVDRLLPVLNNCNNNHNTWDEFNITFDQVLEKNEVISGISVDLWKEVKDMICVKFNK
ncbi:MAG: HD domain-containing protein [Gammaproteobacteria bacterium]|nr:HD domain-containing protein [Gammaproteobacteria bacterium]